MSVGGDSHSGMHGRLGRARFGDGIVAAFPAWVNLARRVNEATQRRDLQGAGLAQGNERMRTFNTRSWGAAAAALMELHIGVWLHCRFNPLT